MMLKLLFNDLFRRSGFVQEERSGMQRIVLHEQAGSILFQKKCRSRHIRISLRGDGSVRVSLPIRCSYSDADKFLCAKMDWVLSAQAKWQQRQTLRKTHGGHTEELRQNAKAILPPRTAQLAAMHGLSYQNVMVKNMHSRWGSCSAQNRLNFSIYLTLLPQALIDYVILHELCHTIHKNHSRSFWELLDQLTQGQARMLAKQMKQYAI